MPKKLTLDEVKLYFENNQCKLISENYTTNKGPIEFMCKCGHTRKSTLTAVKTWKQFNCKDCTPNILNGKINGMHPKTFAKNKHLLETKFERTHKYRSDFLPENYNKELTCWDCKLTKNIRNFPYRINYADNKEKRCKKCCCENHMERRLNATQDQIIQSMIIAAKNSAKKRLKNNRIEAGKFDINLEDIKELIDIQHNKCVYTGYDLEWNINSQHKASIDRIDSDLGYCKCNIQLVCFIVNQAKSNLTEDIFLDMCGKITSIKLGD